MIDTTQEMRTWHMAIEVERVEALVLSGTQPPHHDDVLAAIDVIQDTYESGCQATFNTIEVEQPFTESRLTECERSVLDIIPNVVGIAAIAIWR